ncbi:DUF1684 domain-containing protein [Planctomonas deserti]|uniref:DUF1684 domain-containing protein n=1 Tax=Planctomonas deserti TaxID=2144185 RepID=UPI000D3792FA
MADARTAVETANWRWRVFALYAEVRRISLDDPAAAHALWIRERDQLFATHPASPLLPEHRAAFAGLPVTPYDPAWRFELEVHADRSPERLEVDTGTDGVVPFERLGSVHLPAVGADQPGAELDVWRLASYGGGIFLPVKDALSRVPGGTYGGGRYLLDTIKGSHLGERPGPTTAGAGPVIVLDLNFAYNPSCAYDPAWACPLAPPGNVLPFPVPVGERI